MNKSLSCFAKTIFVGIVTLLSINSAFALQEDRKLPLDIVSDWSEFYNGPEGTPSGIYRGNVVLTQGNLTIQADEATFRLVNGELDNIIATGNPVKIKDLPQLDEAWIFGEGLKLSYFPKKDLLVLETNAKVEQNQDVVNANKITYDLNTRTINAERSPADRVHFTIQMDNRDK